MTTTEERIQEIEEEIRDTKYNKATQHHIGKLKAKLAKLKVQSAKKSAGAGGLGYAVKKTGDATVCLVGFPSVGKSTLLNQLTNAKSEIGAYEFTTLQVVPGVMKYQGAELQLLDVPGLIKGAAEGKGRGREVLAVIRNSDLVLLLVDSQNLDQKQIMVDELLKANIRINEKQPDIQVKKKSRGGITIASTKKLKLDKQSIHTILAEFNYHNADVLIREDINLEQFIDFLAGNRTYLPALFVVNKSDLAAKQPAHRDTVYVSALSGEGLAKLRTQIFRKLGLIRIYMKKQGKKPDYDEPLIVKKGSTIGDVCNGLHKNFYKDFRFAHIWGPSARFGGQQVGLNHALKDEDVLTILKKD